MLSLVLYICLNVRGNKVYLCFFTLQRCASFFITNRECYHTAELSVNELRTWGSLRSGERFELQTIATIPLSQQHIVTNSLSLETEITNFYDSLSSSLSAKGSKFVTETFDILYYSTELHFCVVKANKQKAKLHI